MTKFAFSLQATRGQARAGEMVTAHGVIQTPVFMPVGTQATVKSLDQQDVAQLEASILLGNTYHLYLRPGAEAVAKLGGLHQFMNWRLPILTDSGGFQVFSLGQQLTQSGKQALVKISDQGVRFVSHLDGSEHFFSPSSAIEIQRLLGADIIMAFDECTPDEAQPEYVQEALDRTHRWAGESLEYWQQQGSVSHQGHYQALFGIVQGGSDLELRRQSATVISSLEFDGVAIGGETIGYNMDGTVKILRAIEHILPTNKPRYTMGLGREPQNLVDAVLAGADMFDCVAPTRLARNGALYVGQLELQTASDGTVRPVFVSEFAKSRLQIGNARWAQDQSVIQPGCDCWSCQQGYTRAYMHHLYRTQELTYYRLASIHNLRLMVRLSQQLRQWVLTGQW